MFYHLIYPMSESWSWLNVFRYITLRSFLAFLICAFISIVIGKPFINWIKRKQFGQVIRADGPSGHLKKAGTPTFGGVMMGLAVAIGLLICGNFTSPPLLATVILSFGYLLLGLTDDYLKIMRKNSDGVGAKTKLFWQFGLSLAVCVYLYAQGHLTGDLYFPFLKGPAVDLGWGIIIFAAFVVVGTSNAVNLTDGLDGLAIGPILSSSACLGVLAYLAGHHELASYLYIPYIEGAGELGVLAASMLGAGVGFLWYNFFPAQIFMGDVGSLSLGGALGMMALLTKNEILFVFIGGIFVIEALSVILQVGSYKLRGKRIFKMAPLHHHFELLGWPEPKVIVRFWICGLFLCIFGLATLKLR